MQTKDQIFIKAISILASQGNQTMINLIKEHLDIDILHPSPIDSASLVEQLPDFMASDKQLVGHLQNDSIDAGELIQRKLFALKMRRNALNEQIKLGQHIYIQWVDRVAKANMLDCIV